VSTQGVLSAAAVLHVFTADQVAAHCEEEREAVVEILREHGDLFEPLSATDSPRWRVRDPAALRARIAVPRDVARPRPRSLDGSLQARLLLAEQTLIDCAGEPSAAGRRVMAASAANYVRQFIAGAQPGAAHERWWEIQPATLDELGDRLVADGTAVSRCRLATDLALARLTDRAAARQDVGVGFLVETAAELHRLVTSRELDKQRFRGLYRRFTELAMELTTPLATGDRGAAAPARLLRAVAWRRAGPAAQGGWEAAARAQLELLRGLAQDDPLAGGGGTHLYRVLDRLQHGRRRVAVYQDLLDLLPSRFRWEPEQELLPGAVVAAVAEEGAARLLKHYADVLERDLVNSPYLSDSALVGQVAYRFDEFKVAAGADNTRTTETRRRLLSLFDVPL
jgi:hypothetical protein